MPRRSCPQCERRLPYASRRCTGCGWSHGGGIDPTVRRSTERRRGWILALVMATLLGGSAVATWKADVVADWYAGFAARYLPTGLSSFAVTDTDRGAFFFCARQVAKRMEGEFSVETFPSLSESRSEELADGRYRIVSWVEESRQEGGSIRHGFECTVRHQSGRWTLETLRMEQYAGDGRAPRFAQSD